MKLFTFPELNQTYECNSSKKYFNCLLQFFLPFWNHELCILQRSCTNLKKIIHTLDIKVSTGSNSYIQAIICKAWIVPWVVSEYSKCESGLIAHCLSIFPPCDCWHRVSRSTTEESYCICFICHFVTWHSGEIHWNYNKKSNQILQIVLSLTGLGIHGCLLARGNKKFPWGNQVQDPSCQIGQLKFLSEKINFKISQELWKHR